MKNIILITITIFASITMKAHQTEIATTLLVEQEDNSWVLQISSSLAAFQKEVKIAFEEPYKTPEEFKEMVLEHIKTNLNLSINSKMVHLEEGMVKLGHETQVIFKVVVPNNLHALHIENSVFSNIYNSKNTCIVLKKGFDKKHFELNKNNCFSKDLVVNGNTLVEVSKTNEASFIDASCPYVLMLIIAFVTLNLVSRRKHKNEMEA